MTTSAPLSAPQSDANVDRWPPLPLAPWRETRDTLQLWTQVVGKLKVERAPFENQLWHTALHLTDRGLTTGPLPAGNGAFQAEFDFFSHQLGITTSSGQLQAIPLYPRSVADFYQETMARLAALGIDVRINPMPQEIPDPTPFPEDTLHASYDADAVARWWRALSSSAKVMRRQRSFFTGKASPVHFFWGAFDLAATRHNGDPAPVAPNAGYIRRVAEDEANWAGGFWTGGPGFEDAVYYAYMVPQPEGFDAAAVTPSAAFWSGDLGEFLLPYEAVRTAADPDAALMAFLESTYAAAADLAGWDRERLEIREIPHPH